MENIKIFKSQVDNNNIELNNIHSGKDFVELLIGDDTGVPVRCIFIEALTEDGKEVSISIPNKGDEFQARIFISEKAIPEKWE